MQKIFKRLGNHQGAGRLGGLLIVGGIFTVVFVGLVITVIYLSKREKEKVQGEKKETKATILLTVAVDSQKVTDVLFDTALKKEFFSQESLQVKDVRKASSQEALDSLEKGEAQVALIDVAPLLDKGGGYRLVAPIGHLLLWGVTKNERVAEEAKDLASLSAYPLLSDAREGEENRILLDGLAHQAHATIRYDQVDHQEFFRLKQPPEILLTAEPGISQGLKYGGKVCFRITPAALGLPSSPPTRCLAAKLSYLQGKEGEEATLRLRAALKKASDLIYTNPMGILNDVLYNVYFGQYDLEVLAEVIQRLVQEKAIPREMEVSSPLFMQLARAQLKAQGKDGAQAEGLASQILWKGQKGQ